MMRKFLIAYLVIVFVSCSEKAPKDLLSIKQMQEIEWDLFRADELVEYYQSTDTAYKSKQIREDYYDRIFALHHTTKEVFTRSHNYYTARPKELKKILDSIQAKAEKQAAADSTKSKPDTTVFLKDTSPISRTLDSLKRKSF